LRETFIKINETINNIFVHYSLEQNFRTPNMLQLARVIRWCPNEISV